MHDIYKKPKKDVNVTRLLFKRIPKARFRKLYIYFEGIFNIIFTFLSNYSIINNYWMRLSGISRIIEAQVGVICRSRRLRQITLTEASIILDIPRKPNSIIILLFTWTVLSFTWTILLFTWADTKIMI